MELIKVPLPFEADFPEVCANCLSEGPLRDIQVGLHRKEGPLPRQEFSYGPTIVVPLPVCAACEDTAGREAPNFWNTAWLWLGGMVIAGFVLGRWFNLSPGLCVSITVGFATLLVAWHLRRRKKPGQSSAHRPVWLEDWKGWFTHTEVTLGFSNSEYAERFRKLNKL